MLNKPTLLTVSEVSETYRKHPVTIRVALQDGDLHGRQRTAGGRWLVEAECAEAWSLGNECEHMSAASEPIQLRRTA